MPINFKLTTSLRWLIVIIYLFLCTTIKAQPAIEKLFPEGTTFYRNIPYAKDTLKKHMLDIYLPPHSKNNLPIIIWVHGGAWMLNDKYADMNYMRNTIREFMDKGYALASIDYRYSTTAIFPAQIQDCNAAIQYLYEHATEYKFDRNRMALIGFSAGGHLASLIALSNNNNMSDFYMKGMRHDFKIKCVLDYYGPSDLISIAANPDSSVNNAQSPVALLLGAMPTIRPDIAKKASPVTYVNKNDPPFLIVQGEKDESVPNTQSKELSSWLGINGVPHELIIVPGAPHFGEMFDAEWIREKAFNFLSKHL